jgi:hypothetical protein
MSDGMGSGTEHVGEYTFFYGKGNDKHEIGTVFCVHKKIISTVKRVECVSDRMSYIILRGRWYHIIVLNVNVPTVDKTDDVKDSFYEEIESVFDMFPKYHGNSVRRFPRQSRQGRRFEQT